MASDAIDSSALSETQEKILSLSSQFPVLLSIVGSSVIIFHVWQHPSSSTSLPAPYRRILLMLSACDILNSITLALAPFLNHDAWVWSFGNEATCTMLGTLQQLALSTVWYSGLLSLYFVMTVRWGWKQEDFGRKVEPWWHVGIWLFSIITSFTGAVMGFYGPLNLGPGCWVKDYPEGCYEDPNMSCNLSIGFIFGGIPVTSMLLLLIADNLLLYCHVRKTIGKGYKYDVTRQTQPQASQVDSAIEAPQNILVTSSAPNLDKSARSECRISCRSNQETRVRDVGTQSFLYVTTYFLAFLWTYILRTIEAAGYVNERKLFPLLLIQSIFLPSQGFFNMLVFLRPTYVRLRRKFPNKSRLWCIRRALRGNHNNPQCEKASKTSRVKWQTNAEKGIGD